MYFQRVIENVTSDGFPNTATACWESHISRHVESFKYAITLSLVVFREGNVSAEIG